MIKAIYKPVRKPFPKVILPSFESLTFFIPKNKKTKANNMLAKPIIAFGSFSGLDFMYIVMQIITIETIKPPRRPFFKIIFLISKCLISNINKKVLKKIIFEDLN
jgi:hypothetical protein